MAATQIGIVYATGSGMVRRWIVPDRDTDLKDKHPVVLGEAMLIVPADSIKSPADVDAAVARVIGKQPPSPRCAVIDALGNVESVIMADPDLDAVPGKTVVLHADAVPGWKLVGGVLIAPVTVDLPPIDFLPKAKLP